MSDQDLHLQMLAMLLNTSGSQHHNTTHHASGKFDLADLLTTIRPEDQAAIIQILGLTPNIQIKFPCSGLSAQTVAC